jgi:predicted glycoside hydrolase/deacetylase ChbG (UPF0249 family)
MRIVINADDFGVSDDTVAATIDCFEKGALTSATIMVNTPATAAAVDFARSHPEFSFGVHLTFCGDGEGIERPVSEPADVAALVDHHGRFLPTTTVRARAMLGRVPADQIERETRAQLERLGDWGVPVSHVDSHSHLHKIGPFREALSRVLPRFGIRRVRNVQNIYLRPQLLNVTYWLGGTWRRRVKEAFDTTDYHYMPSSGLDSGWTEALLARLARLPASASAEVGMHPGFAEEWRRREREDTLAFAGAAREAGHSLVPWSEVLHEEPG